MLYNCIIPFPQYNFVFIFKVKALPMSTAIAVSISTTYDCSLERAFKTPMLCDVTKIHTGYGLMPKLTHCTEDANWGKPGSTKRVFAAASPTFKGGETSMDKVLEREENKHWKIQVSEFKSWMLGFYKFEGVWDTTELAPNKIQVDYTYTLYAKGILYYPFNWLFVKLFWKKYMVHVTENIRQLIKNKEPYLYE